MSDSADTEPHAPPKRLSRSTDDRMLAGVCGGLADYTGLDPVIFRVTFAVATIFGGAGLLAYALAWLIIPEASEPESRATALLRDRDPGRILLYVIGAVVLLSVVGPFGDPFRSHWGGGGFGLLVLVGLGAWYWRHERHDDADRARPHPPVPPVPPAVPAPAPFLGTADPTVTMPVAPPPLRRPPRPKGSARLLAATASAVLVAVGALTTVQLAGWADVSVETALAVCLLVVGAGLLVGTFYGRSRALIAIGLVLTLATGVASVAGLSLRGGTGHREWQPRSAEDLARTYRLGVGLGELDLSRVELGARTTRIDATVGIGTLRVTLPPTGTVHVHVHTGIGDAVVLERAISGVDVDERSTIDQASGDDLVLDVHVGIGHLEVLR